MMKISEITSLKEIRHVHFIGVGGIGMSSIAQYLVDLGIIVSGSDRALDNPENSRIVNPLRARGIKLFPQDGSYTDFSVPDLLVYSSAIEEDNPDLQAGKKIPHMHRAEVLALCIRYESKKISIAVCGSCGKTSVTAWLTETLVNANADPVMIGGGISNSFISEDLTGNYRPGQGNYLVFEADESDKSLLNYNPDYALILNIGTDHYDKDELIEMFREFAGKVKRGFVISKEVYDLLGSDCFVNSDVCIFDEEEKEKRNSSEKTWIMEKYTPGKGIFSSNQDDSVIEIKLPIPGKHSGLNALAVLCTMNLLGLQDERTIDNIEAFMGVWRRADLAGLNSNGAKIYDDYAHNVEKIVSSIKTAREEGKRVISIFQPHGFKPLEFMRDALLAELENNLSNQDLFCFLPVYYAGGSASFAPTSEEVANSYISNGTKKYKNFKSRKELKLFLEEMTTKDDIVLIMGARDNSLSDFAVELTC